jgi:hypothetical protein
MTKDPRTLNCECFSNVGGKLLLFQKTSHQKQFIKKILNLVLCKIDYLKINSCSSSKVLTKQIFKIKLNKFLIWILHIDHLTQFLMISMALKWCHINICNKVSNLAIVWYDFWLDCDCTDYDGFWSSSNDAFHDFPSFNFVTMI